MRKDQKITKKGSTAEPHCLFSLFSGLAIVACVCSLTEDCEKWERIFWGLIALYWFIRSEVV